MRWQRTRFLLRRATVCFAKQGRKPSDEHSRGVEVERQEIYDASELRGYMISLLVPTRKRIKSLIRFLNSVEETCSSPRNLEVLIRIDDDDVETIQFVDKYITKSSLVIKTVIGSRGKGYVDAPRRLEELCQNSNGRILMYLADDVQLMTKDWDEKILNTYNNSIYDDKIFLIKTAHNQEENPDWPLFPAITREWLNATGHFSNFYAVDTELYLLSKLINREIFLKDIEIIHRRPDFQTGIIDGKIDKTFVEGRLSVESGLTKRFSFSSDEGIAKIIDDAIKLKSQISCLNNQGKKVQVPAVMKNLWWKYFLRIQLRSIRARLKIN